MLPRILVASDAHNESRDKEAIVLPDLTDVDVCIVAGDFDQPIAQAIRHLQAASGGDKDIIYVAGNHEHYGKVYRENVVEGYRACDECPNVHFLENEVVTIKGVRFIGASLWTDYAINGNARFGKMAAQRDIHDFEHIYESEGKLVTPEFFERLHDQSRRFITSALSVPFDGPTVVVSHHAPHPGSIFHWYRGDQRNAAYVSDLTEVIYKGAPDLWVHGHTHHSFDYTVFKTRIICNPVGYQDRPNPEYNPRLIVDAAEFIKRANDAAPSYEDLFAGMLEED